MVERERGERPIWSRKLLLELRDSQEEEKSDEVEEESVERDQIFSNGKCDSSTIDGTHRLPLLLVAQGLSL